MISNPPKHANVFEHTEGLGWFMFYFMLCGFVGGLVGALINKFVGYWKPQSRYACLSAFLGQLVMNGLFFWAFFEFLKVQTRSGNLKVDDWIGNTFQGLIFATTFYALQSELADNLSCVLA